MDSHREEFFYFASGSRNLFGALHIPGRGNGCGVVVCSPFGEEKIRTYRVIRNFAVLLQNHGYTVLRFDFMGEGDSEGDFQESTIETRISNVLDAVGWLREAGGVGEVVLHGLRFGATVAALSATRLEGIRRIVLWQPVVEGKAYFYNILRSNLTLQNRMYKKILYTREQLIQKMQEGECVNSEGYMLSWDLYRQGTSIDLRHALNEFSGSSLLAQISRDEAQQKDLAELHGCLMRNGGQHTYEILPIEFLWEDLKFYRPYGERIFATTLNWMDGRT